MKLALRLLKIIMIVSLIAIIILICLASRIPNPIKTLLWGPELGMNPNIVWVSEDESIFFYEWSESHDCRYGEFQSGDEIIPFELYNVNRAINTSRYHPGIYSVEPVIGGAYRINFKYDTLKMTVIFYNEEENKFNDEEKEIIFHKEIVDQ